MKLALRIIVIVVVVTAALFLLASNGLNDIQHMQINNIDLSQLDDGVYTGSFKKTRWKHDVDVTIKDHRIVAIDNTNKLAGFNKTTADDATKLMIEKQTILIDAVAGATVNTKAFQKAVENALAGGKKK
jgi:uncharacterized protein with FMN-binding domain